MLYWSRGERTWLPRPRRSSSKGLLAAPVRVLDGRLLVEPIGMGVPKGRDAIAAAYVGKFVEEAKAAGLVKSAIDRAGLRGVVVAPLK